MASASSGLGSRTSTTECLMDRHVSSTASKWLNLVLGIGAVGRIIAHNPLPHGDTSSQGLSLQDACYRLQIGLFSVIGPT